METVALEKKELHPDQTSQKQQLEDRDIQLPNTQEEPNRKVKQEYKRPNYLLRLL